MLQKGSLIRHMLDKRRYEKDAEPPLMKGETNTTVSMFLSMLCATPVDDYISIEGWTYMVSLLMTRKCVLCFLASRNVMKFHVCVCVFMPYR